MNPIDFKALGAIADIRIPPPQELEVANPTECMSRSKEGTTQTGKFIASCALLATATDRTVAVDKATCKVCICNGPAILTDNRALRKHVLQVAYSATIAGKDALEPAAPDDASLAVAIENVKQWASDDIARRFVDSLVYHESVSAEKGLALLNDHDLVEVG